LHSHRDQDRNGKDFLIEQTFPLLQTLVHVLNNTYPTLAGTPAEKSTVASHRDSGTDLPIGVDRDSPGGPKFVPQTSHAVLQLACYFRLLKIYYSVLEQIGSYILIIGSISESQYIRSLDCQIESFSTPSLSSLHIRTLLQILG